MQKLSTLAVVIGTASAVASTVRAGNAKVETAIEGMSDREFVSRFRAFWHEQATKNSMMKNNVGGYLKRIK